MASPNKTRVILDKKIDHSGYENLPTALDPTGPLAFNGDPTTKAINFFTENTRIHRHALRYGEDQKLIPGNDKYKKFGPIFKTSYKLLAGGPRSGFITYSGIEVLVALPSNLGDGPNPVHVKWHGGGFFTGDANYWPWFADHLIDMANQHHAVTFIPNYRLLGPHNGEDIMEDVKQFWVWFRKSIFQYKNDQGELKPLNLDLGRVMVSGESAGGFIAMESWLIDAPIRTVYVQYPMLKRYEREFGQKYMGLDVKLSKDDLKAKVKAYQDKVEELRKEDQLWHVTGATPPDRMPMAYASSSTDTWGEFFNTKDIFERVEDFESNPNSNADLVMLHGVEDDTVPIRFSKLFREQVKTKLNASCELYEVPGVKHGFDYLVDETDSRLWVVRDHVVRSWIDRPVQG